MSFSRARYVTICQQFLVTAAVLAVGLSAAGVMTLTIVAPEQSAPTTSGAAPRFSSAVHISDETYADTSPVKPKVKEVRAVGVDPEAARSLTSQQLTATPAPAPDSQPDSQPSPEPSPAPGADQHARTAPVAPAAPQALRLAVLTTPQPVHGYATVGATWAHGVELGEDDIAVQVRTRTKGTWSQWQALDYHDEHGPDASDEESAKTRPGTDPLVIGDVDQVQMKAETRSGKAPADMQLAVIDPGAGTLKQEQPAIDTAKLPTSAKDARTAPVQSTGTDATNELADADVSLQAMQTAPRPKIYSRAQWGADESVRESGPPEYGTIKTGFIHHTVNANDYTRAQVPSLIRGIYAYHVLSRGWRDIGYNFLVDRFGRIWEGRYGGVARPVVGAHTLGYNEVSFAMSAIGNFDVARPPQAVVDAYARLFAWKLSLYNIPADRTHIWVKNRYLNAINGHRDVGQTACPGRYLYARIPDVRRLAAKIQDAAQTAPTPTPTPTPPPSDPNSIDKPIISVPAGMPSPLTRPRAAASQPKISFPVRQSLAGSGWPDLVTKASDGDIRVTPGGGMLDFAKRTLSSGPWKQMTEITAIGDVTADGRKDVLARNGSTGRTGVFPGLSGGRVSSKAYRWTSAFRNADLLIAAGDWNRDGRRDVISRNSRTHRLYLFLGAGHGTFQSARLIRKGWNYARTTGVGDFNRDGHVDLVGWRESDGALVLWPGTGGTTLATAFGRAKVLTTVGKLTALAGGFDMTGDANPDLLIRKSGSGRTMVLAGDGKGGIEAEYGPFWNTRRMALVSVAPMASVRRGDVVARDNRTGDLVVVKNNGRRNLGKVLAGNLTRLPAEETLSVGDWNRDGHNDIITREYGGKRLTLWPGQGNGKFMRGRSLGNDWATVTQLAAVGDVTGDGNPDLMGSINDGRMIIWPGNRLKGIKAPVWAAGQLQTYNQIGDGSWYTSQPAPMYRSSDGLFVPAGGGSDSAARQTSSRVSRDFDQMIGVGDVNGDRRADVLARSRSTGDIWLLPGKASGGFGAQVWVAAGFAGYPSVG